MAVRRLASPARPHILLPSSALSYPILNLQARDVWLPVGSGGLSPLRHRRRPLPPAPFLHQRRAPPPPPPISHRVPPLQIADSVDNYTFITRHLHHQHPRKGTYIYLAILSLRLDVFGDAEYVCGRWKIRFREYSLKCHSWGFRFSRSFLGYNSDDCLRVETWVLRKVARFD